MFFIQAPNQNPFIMPKHSTLCGFLLLLLVGFTLPGLAQKPILDVGLRLQKTVNLYNENGLSVQYSHPTLCYDKLYFGLSYVTSRLGTAINSNAIKQDNYILSGTWMFRPQHVVRPFARLNTGYFHADYEYAIFDDLDNTSVLLSPEGGVCFETHLPIKISLSMGYNVITGNGVNGAGTLFPLYFQTTLSWNVFK